MITTVTLNPAIDKVVEVNELTLGQVHRVSNQVVSLGGKSINVARILTGLSCKTKAVCYLGEKNIGEIEALSKEDSIELDPIMLEGITRTNTKLVEPDKSYRTTDINEIGFSVNEEQLNAMTKLISDCADASDYLVVSGSLPQGVHVSYYKELALNLGSQTKVIIDADGEILMAAMEGSPFLIKPNIHELESAVGRTLENDADIIEVCKELITTYGITYILVSLGDKGSILVGASLVLIAEAMKVQVVSTVGAGDSMLAGFIYGLSECAYEPTVGQLKKALACGVASSSIAISTQEHKSFEATQLIEVANKVIIKEISI